MFDGQTLADSPANVRRNRNTNTTQSLSLERYMVAQQLPSLSFDLVARRLRENEQAEPKSAESDTLLLRGTRYR